VLLVTLAPGRGQVVRPSAFRRCHIARWGSRLNRTYTPRSSPPPRSRTLPHPPPRPAPPPPLQGERVLREWPIPPECFDTDSGRLLDWVAERTLGVAAEVGRPAPGAPLVVGFCFSFAFQQTALDNGVLLLWTKNFRGSGLVGRDVVAALVAAFAARGAVARVPALVNDTVAALVAARYADPAARAAFILGTGTNAACLMDAARMRGLPPGYRPRGAQMVVNTEWGDLAAAELPRCEEDVWVDCASANPGRGTFEKLVAGLYLGEVARRVMLRLAGAGALFGGAGCGAPGQGLARPGAFGSAALAAVDADASPGLGATAAAVAAAFAVARPSRADLQAVQRVCRMVGRRSVRLVAAGLAAVVAAAGGASPGRPCAVAVDGSVFARYPGYQEALGRALAEVMGAEAAGAVALRLVPDGSIMGAAVLAAAVAAGEVGAQQQGRGAGEVQG
jgi:hexokinase